MKLSVIIVNYNVRYFLEQALLSVREAVKGLEAEVFVVDNNSVDDSVRMVEEKFPEVQLIANKDNTGFAVANNQAIRLSQGEYVLLLNPDTVVEEDTFHKCIRFMDNHPEAGGLGVKMIDGSGKFLPESKRGFPSPWVSFSKAFGLAKIFPKSKFFNHYHLGYLSNDKIHEVDVLAGAFMMLRKSVLDEVGLLDEAFFMYGEDIDLSYRIVKGGYKNYYFPETTIIHYKGESTKKGSLNYVKTFYKAMIIFAKKHFKGEKAVFLIAMLRFAIYLRAFMTLANNFLKKIWLPAVDAMVIFGGMFILKSYWAKMYFNFSGYYPANFMTLIVPGYILFWLGGIFFSGGYDERNNLRRLVRGILMGSLALAAVYGFLPLGYRTSRMLLVLGSIWALISVIGIRAVAHFVKFRNFEIGREKVKNLIIVGSEKEGKRVLNLMNQLQVTTNFIGFVSPYKSYDSHLFLSNLTQLEEVVHIYKIEEIIFCSTDVQAQDIMKWMATLGADIHYRIVPKESLSIIGSSSKNEVGELYTIDIQYAISTPMQRRNKRLFDILWSVVVLVFLPVFLLFGKKGFIFIKNIIPVFFGKKTWVGYADAPELKMLPPIKRGVFSPLKPLKIYSISPENVSRLNHLYAKDYNIWKDINIMLTN